MAERFWLDRIVAQSYGDQLIPLLEKLFSEDYIAIIDETILDVGAFHGKCEWLDEQLLDGHILVQLSTDRYIDYMVSKPFRWFSCGVTTEALESFSQAIKILPNGAEIEEMYYFISGYFSNHSKWFYRHNHWEPASLPLDDLETLKFKNDYYPAFMDVFIAAEATGRMDLFEKFNMDFARAKAQEHECQYLLGKTGIIQLS